MSKIIDSLVQQDLDSKDYAAVLLARFHFESPINTLRYTNAPQNIYWDEGSPAGEVEYQGLGNLVSIDSVTETADIAANTMNFTLSGISSTNLNVTLDRLLYQNKACYLWYGLLDKQTYAIQGGQTGPILIYRGLMDYANITMDQQEITISLNTSSRLTDWEKAKGGRFNHEYQKRYVDSTDEGFKYVVPLQGKEIMWAGKSASDPGGGDWLGTNNPNYTPSGGGGTNGGCFIANTQISINNDGYKYIQDLKEGDSVLTPAGIEKIKSVLKYNYTGNLYSINDSEYFVTGGHPFRTSNGWNSFENVEPDSIDYNPNLNTKILEVNSILYRKDINEKILTIKSKYVENLEVYNLTVDGTPEYFANNYLVHNVKDASVDETPDD